jgi:hypothetical protein
MKDRWVCILNTFRDKNTTSNAQDVSQVPEDKFSSILNHTGNSSLLPSPIELRKFFDALPEPFCDSDTIPDPSGELRADASGRIALV